jgi:RNA polymerase sigma-B factor
LFKPPGGWAITVSTARWISAGGHQPAKPDVTAQRIERVMIRPSSSPSESTREQLLNDYHWLTVSLARRVAGRARGESIDDLTQVALLGLVRAIDRYDATRGVPFAAYASATITGELKHYLRDSSWMVRPSRRVQDLYLRVAEEQRELALELGRHPTPAASSGLCK